MEKFFKKEEKKKEKEKKNRDNLGDAKKTKKKKKKRKKIDERNSIFKNVQVCSMVDPCILTTIAFQFQGTIQNGPTYILIFVGNSNFEGTLLNQKNGSIKHVFIRMDL